MTFREMNLRVFRGEPVPHVLFQPRFEPWFAWSGEFGGLPDRFRNCDVRTAYDEAGCSMRYVHYYTDNPSPVVQGFDAAVRIEESVTETDRRRVLHTPHGVLVEHHARTIDNTWREVGFPVQTADDLRKLGWLFRHIQYSFSSENFAQGSAFVGERGEPQFWVPKSPYQELAQHWMKLEDFIFALADCPEVVEEVMVAIDASYDPLYKQIIASGQVRIVNFGENLHEQLMSPEYFRRYHLPFYAKRCGQLRAAGIFTHVHLDGYFHNLLPLLREMACDGLEALTPKPQGDVEIEEMAEHMAGKILLDGIPAVLFLDMYSREQLLECVEKLVRLLHPRLVLGISDELPEAAGEEGFERVKLVADWCRRHALL
jgi:hypothetical protein